MWMKDTTATQILAIVFNKHKYITNTDVTPEDRVISAAGKLEDDLKGCMPPHLSESTPNQLERIGTILDIGWMQKVQQYPPGKTPTSPPPPLQTPKPTSLETLLISPTGPPPRVVTPPSMEPPKVMPHPRVVPPPRASDLVNPRRSPQMEALHNDIKYEVDALARNTRIQTGKRGSTTQEAMLIAVAQLRVTLAHLAQRKFPIEILSAVLDKNTFEIMEYQRMMNNPQ